MDFFEHRYYRLNKKFMKFFGHWPYQSLRVRVILNIAALSLGFSHIIPHVIAVVKNRHDREFLMECALGSLFIGFATSKYMFSMLNAPNNLKLLTHIRAVWANLADDPDINVLHEYAYMGRRLTIVYGATSYIIGILVTIQPVVPKFIDVLLKNGTEPGDFPIPIDYMSIDVQENYFYIVLHSFVCISLAFFTSMTYDCMLLVYVQHGCGLFATLGRKLERIGCNERSSEKERTVDTSRKSGVSLKDLAFYITIHDDAIEFAELIEDSYTWCFFCIMGLNMLLISVCGVQILAKASKPQDSMRYVAAIMIAVLHVYIDSYMAQRLLDHSTNIRQHIAKGKWYTLPPKYQKILLFMTMRCNTPCQITAGKIIVMSVESFAMILKTSVSYFTLLRST